MIGSFFIIFSLKSFRTAKLKYHDFRQKEMRNLNNWEFSCNKVDLVNKNKY